MIKLLKSIIPFGKPRYTYGSNFGGMDAGDGAHSELGLDHKTRPYDPSLWPTDYADSTDPIAIALDAAVDMTSSCRSATGSTGWCAWSDPWIALLDANGWPDIIIYDVDISITIPATLLGNATEKNIPILRMSNDDYFWNTSAPANEKQEPYRVKDAWEMMHTWHDLAEALGVPNVDTLMETERNEFCAAAGRFKKSAKTAHENGVRAMAGNFPRQD